MKKNVFLAAVCAVMAIALSCLFVACGDAREPLSPGGPETPFVPEEYLEDPALEIYSQRAHIGYFESLENLSHFDDYYSSGEPAFVIPGLNEGENFVLQGIAYCERQNWALLAGYVKPTTQNKNSVIFVIDMSKYVKAAENTFFKGALIKEILLEKADGSAFTGHAGGIAVSENSVWIANDGKLFYIPLEKVISAPTSSRIALEKSVTVPVNASYVEYSAGTLWVGEFEYARDDYITDATHHDAQNSSLTAWTVGYALNETGADGYDAATGIKAENLGDVAIPDIALWHGSKVQGMTAVSDGENLKVILSTSYGRKNLSSLQTYDVPWRAQTELFVSVGGRDVRCFALRGAKTIIAPPMLEDLAYLRDGEKDCVLLASESGSFCYHGAENSKSTYPTDLVWKLTIA